MYNHGALPATGGVLPATGAGALLTGSNLLWIALGAFALIALGLALVRAAGTYRA